MMANEQQIIDEVLLIIQVKEIEKITDINNIGLINSITDVNVMNLTVTNDIIRDMLFNDWLDKCRNNNDISKFIEFVNTMWSDMLVNIESKENLIYYTYRLEGDVPRMDFNYLYSVVSSSLKSE